VNRGKQTHESINSKEEEDATLATDNLHWIHKRKPKGLKKWEIFINLDKDISLIFRGKVLK
jgi:hypothetical protein